jgi:hypothetical protein
MVFLLYELDFYNQDGEFYFSKVGRSLHTGSFSHLYSDLRAALQNFLQERKVLASSDHMEHCDISIWLSALQTFLPR